MASWWNVMNRLDKLSLFRFVYFTRANMCIHVFLGFILPESMELLASLESSRSLADRFLPLGGVISYGGSDSGHLRGFQVL